jgi:hypothetical protein
MHSAAWLFVLGGALGCAVSPPASGSDASSTRDGEGPPVEAATDAMGSRDAEEDASPGHGEDGSPPADAELAVDAVVPPPPPSSGPYLLLPREELLALPMSGAAWDALLRVADGSLGEPDLTDQNNKHAVRTLAVALVYARTGDESYRTTALASIVGAFESEDRVGDPTNGALALGRSLGAYVLAADFIDLARASPSDDTRFRAWLDAIRTDEVGTHGRWSVLTHTHEDSANNWGAFAGASRIAASLYLGDTDDVARAARVLQGFLGDRTAWSMFQGQIDDLGDDEATWACDASRSGFVPINGPCARFGIDLDGAIVRDVYRGGPLSASGGWPPVDPGISYTLETFQGLVVQAELLYRNGYPDAWNWSDQALRRAAALVSRSGDAGGQTWNNSSVSQHVPWLLNARYGLGLPTRPAGYGRVFGYTDWLYGG